MNPSNRSFFISIPFEESSSIPFEESSSRFTQIYTSHYWSIIQKIHSPCEEMQKMRKKGPSEICPVAASRNNIVTTRDSTHSRRRIAVSMHCYGERIVTSMFLRIYTSLASIVTLQPRWICRSVAFSFFFFFFFKLISFKIGRALFRVPCFRDNSKFRKIFLLLKIFPSSSI